VAGKLDNVTALTPRDATPLRVVSYEYSNLYGKERYNPDELATRKGLHIYRKMMQDEQVKAVMLFRRGSITARGYEFVYEHDSPVPTEERQRRVKFFMVACDKIRGSFQDGLNAILTGHQFGFSMTEKVYDTITYEGRPYTGLAQLLPREPFWWRFFTDKYGVLDHVEQHIGADRTTVDIKKFIHYVHAPEIDRWYGESDLRAAHRSWYTKDVIVKLYALYLERFAGGFAYAEVTPEANIGANSPEYRALQAALSDMRNLASLILPPGVKLTVFQPSNSGEYREALTFFDLAIAKSVLVPNLLGLSHTGQTGAYSQSQTQLEAYFMTTANDTARLQDVLNEQLFKDLGDINFGDGEYPKFRFKPASIEHVKWIVDTWQKLTSSNAVMATEADEKHLRDLLDMPVRTEEDVLMKETQLELDAKGMENQAKFAPKPTLPANFTIVNQPPAREDFHTPGGHDHDQQNHAGSVVDGRNYAQDGQVFRTRDGGYAIRTNRQKTGYDQISIERGTMWYNKSTNQQGRIRQIDYKGARAQVDWDNRHDEWVPVTKFPSFEYVGTDGENEFSDARVPRAIAFTSALNRVDFALIDQRTNKAQADTVEEVGQLAVRAIKRLLTPERLAELLDADVSDIGQLTFPGADVGKIKGAFKEGLAAAWAVGANSAERELQKAQSPQASFTDLRNKAGDYFESNGFRMAANLTDGMRGIIQNELLLAVKSGTRPEEVIWNIYDRLIRKGYFMLRSVEREDPREDVLAQVTRLLGEAFESANVPAYLNTLVRTNTFEALNEARFAAFEDPDLAGFVVAYEYSAILDNNTTEICTALDDSIYSQDNPVWETHRPPNHYNCRSLLVPILITDKWDGVESPPPSVQPQDGF
jgi:SPP1 gp7 family putative phage head morphogenesis protein